VFSVDVFQTSSLWFQLGAVTLSTEQSLLQEIVSGGV
jgi:hypothetical protein